MDCINLKERFGRRYRVEYEESYFAEHGSRVTVDDPWLQIIPCRFGHFFPWDATRLAASVDGHPNIAGVLRRLPGVAIVQAGDFGEVTVAFTLDRFDEVAAIMRPKRRRVGRVLTDEERRRFIAAGVAHRFSVPDTGQNATSEAQTSVLGGVPV